MSLVDDPDLATFDPQNRANCSNIDDNPVHISGQDKLIGVQIVGTTRRAKFIAISELTDDYLDTTGVLSSFEGELSSGNLISLITDRGQFGFGPGDNLNSTFVFLSFSSSLLFNCTDRSLVFIALKFCISFSLSL